MKENNNIINKFDYLIKNIFIPQNNSDSINVIKFNNDIDTININKINLLIIFHKINIL